MFTQAAKCDNDTTAKLGQGQGLSSSLRTLWKSHTIGIPTKIRLLKSLLWPILSYGCESWTLKSTDEDRIKSFEMKAFRQILRVTWTDKRTNDWVLSKAGTEPFLLQSVNKRKLSYYGHVLWKEGNCTEKEIMQGTTSGQRRRGRSRTRWQDNTTKWTGLTGDCLL